MTEEPRRRRGPIELLLLVLLALGLALFFLDYVLGGTQAVGYLWFQARQAALDFLAWQVQAYVLILVPVLALSAYAMRHALPIIEIPLLGAGSLEAHWMKVWYWPGSFHLEQGEATWREGRRRAFINKAFIARKGLLFGYGVTVPVERISDDVDGEIVYDSANIPAYESRTQHRRLMRELQERSVRKNEHGGKP